MRLFQWTFNLAAAASALLFLAALLLWVRTYSKCDDVTCSRPTKAHPAARPPAAAARGGWYWPTVNGYYYHVFTLPGRIGIDVTAGESANPRYTFDHMTSDARAVDSDARGYRLPYLPRGNPEYFLWTDWLKGSDGEIHEVGTLGEFPCVAYPLWLVCAALAVPPAIRVFATVRGRKRARRNACVSCGYDPRATPGRCPECGTSTKVAMR